MNRDEMLVKLDVSADQLQDLLQKFRGFLATLDKHQHAIVKRSLPTMAEALQAFGPSVNEAELAELFEGDSRHQPVIICLPAQHHHVRK